MSGFLAKIDFLMTKKNPTWVRRQVLLQNVNCSPLLPDNEKPIESLLYGELNESTSGFLIYFSFKFFF